MGIFKMKLVKGDNKGSDFGLIGKGIEVTGNIQFADQLHVEGKITGKLNSESGSLIVGESGHIEAQIDVGTCIIHGAISGDLVARSRVEIHKTGRMQGDVITPVLVVEEGAIFNGAIKMGGQADGRLLEEALTDDPDREGQRKAKGA
jgi:cytoskeletal protein CcmA (bactofilin family)